MSFVNPGRGTFQFSQRRNALAFWIGSAVVSVGVVLHLPMFWMARNSGFNMSGMPHGCGHAARHAADRGRNRPPRVMVLLPNHTARCRHMQHDPRRRKIAPALRRALEADGRLGGGAHHRHHETGQPRIRDAGDAGRNTGWIGQPLALLPLSALFGTAAGSFIWGALSDLYGRRASILLSSVMFVGTSICGAMPSFWWNVAMCFLMGAAAGGDAAGCPTRCLRKSCRRSTAAGCPLARWAASAPSAVISRPAHCRRCCSHFSGGASCGSSTCPPACC